LIDSTGVDYASSAEAFIVSTVVTYLRRIITTVVGIFPITRGSAYIVDTYSLCGIVIAV